MNLIGIGVKDQAGKAKGLGHVHIGKQFQSAFADRALAYAAIRIAQRLQNFVAAELDALILQFGPLAAPVAGQIGAFEDLVIVQHLRAAPGSRSTQETVPPASASQWRP